MLAIERAAVLFYIALNAPPKLTSATLVTAAEVKQPGGDAMAPLDPKEFRRRLHELAETQGWVHHVANLDTGQLLTFPLDRPVAPLSRAERLSRLGHFFDPSIFGGPRYKLTARTPYQASPKAGLIIRDFPYHPMELREPNSARPDPDHQQRSAHRGPHLHPASSARAFETGIQFVTFESISFGPTLLPPTGDVEL
jgi:hypothetical protein